MFAKVEKTIIGKVTKKIAYQDFLEFAIRKSFVRLPPPGSSHPPPGWVRGPWPIWRPQKKSRDKHRGINRISFALAIVLAYLMNMAEYAKSMPSPKQHYANTMLTPCLELFSLPFCNLLILVVTFVSYD